MTLNDVIRMIPPDNEFGGEPQGEWKTEVFYDNSLSYSRPISHPGPKKRFARHPNILIYGQRGSGMTNMIERAAFLRRLTILSWKQSKRQQTKRWSKRKVNQTKKYA